ncbi:hypothetical protein GOV11_01775 [Candidatus Woesearchaeota archaeon]|nr:hypothetical protein [Candidatus Woesearchaeota archaeon]
MSPLRVTKDPVFNSILRSVVSGPKSLEEVMAYSSGKGYSKEYVKDIADRCVRLGYFRRNRDGKLDMPYF